MVRVFLIIALLASSLASSPQAVYSDPTVSASIIATGSAHRAALNKTNDNLTLIQKGQLLVMGELAVANNVQKNIYEGLTQISGALRNAMGIKRSAQYLVDIFENMQKVKDHAVGNPALLLFAEEGGRKFRNEAIELSSYITEFAMKGGKDNLMDAGERQKIVTHIEDQMLILSAISYGMHRSMFYAKRRGILKSINPWQTWVNRDVQIADDVVREFEYLKK